MAITRGQPSNLLAAAPSGTSNTVTWPVAPTAGDKVMLWFWTANSDASAIVSVVDNGSPATTFQLATAQLVSGNHAWIYYGDQVQPSGAYSVTVTLDLSGVDIEVFGLALKGALDGPPADVNHVNNGLANSASTGVSGAGAGNYYAAVISIAGGGNPVGISSGGSFVQQMAQQDGGAHQAGAVADLIGDGPQACTFSWTGTAATSGTAIAVFPPSGDSVAMTRPLSVPSL